VNALKPKPRAAALLMALALALAAAGAQAQSSCSSDGQPRPSGLLERFVNADCEPCWRATDTPRPGRGELALDWVLPGSRGEDAPLSTVAVREALARLQALALTRPQQDAASRRKARAGGERLRVAHGLPFGGYIGTSIELKPGRGGPWQAWLLLVETLPAGTEGSPVERTLVRNVLQLTWDSQTPRSEVRRGSFYETRSMQIPTGADAARLRVVGWVEDARGALKGIAASRCTSAPARG
jgi:hypothetical protein